MTDPFREQRLSPEEVRRIVKRAVELAERDPDTAATEQSLTREELERAAAVLGIPAGAIARAAGLREKIVPVRVAKPSWVLGASSRIHLETEIDAAPTAADREDLVEIVREVVGPANVETVGRAITWRSQCGIVRLRSRDGSTHLTADVESGTGWLAIIIVSMFGALFALIVMLSSMHLDWIVWFLPIFLLARILFMAWMQRAERTINQALRAISEHSADWPRRGARTRIAALHREETEDAEEEAEAEAEAMEPAVRRRRR